MKGETNRIILVAWLWGMMVMALSLLLGAWWPLRPLAAAGCGLFGILGVLWLLDATQSGPLASDRRSLRWFGLNTAYSLAYGQRRLLPHIWRVPEADPWAFRSRQRAVPDHRSGAPGGFRP